MRNYGKIVIPESMQDYRSGWDYIDEAEVPSTNRTTDDLLLRLGHENLDQLTATLPHRSVILDVGGGKSPFFRDIAEARPDISSIIIDYNYPKNLPDDYESGPGNLTYVAGDMRALPFEPESFDWIFSNWAISYLFDEEREEVFGDLYRLTKPGGKISVGPFYVDQPGLLPPENVKTFIKGVDVDDSNIASWAKEHGRRVRNPGQLFIPLR